MQVIRKEKKREKENKPAESLMCAAFHVKVKECAEPPHGLLFYLQCKHTGVVCTLSDTVFRRKRGGG